VSTECSTENFRDRTV